MAVVGIVDNGGDVVIDQVAVEADLAQGPNDLGEIQVALPEEAPLKVLGGAARVTEVDVEDPV